MYFRYFKSINSFEPLSSFATLSISLPSHVLNRNTLCDERLNELTRVARLHTATVQIQSRLFQI